MNLNLTVLIDLKDNTFKVTNHDKFLYLSYDKLVQQVIDMRVIEMVDAAQRIAEHIVKSFMPYLPFESDKELLEFYLAINNVVSMFYMKEFTKDVNQSLM